MRLAGMSSPHPTEDNMLDENHTINLIDQIHPDLFCVPSLVYAYQLDYFRWRIVVCHRPTTIDLTNQQLLKRLEGEEELLRAYNPRGGKEDSWLWASPCDFGNIKPGKFIPIKRGMVLRLLDNKGHEGYLEVGDRLLLIANTGTALVVKPLTGEKKGLNLRICRLIYIARRRGVPGRRIKHMSQFPVVGGFAVEEDQNNDFSPAINICRLN
ncbi:hypothetical protein MJO29_000424 [Puccinia striiformis f. sp. tritici]|nr:hypothetical protein MJO29_000424 [Puccinia striiformis f. sp. tritici]